MDGQDFHQIVCSELVRIIWVIWPLDTHHSTKLFNPFSSTSSHIILNRIENQEILPSTVIQCQTVKSNFSLSSLLARPQKKILCYYRLIFIRQVTVVNQLVLKSRRSLSIAGTIRSDEGLTLETSAF